MKKFHIYSIIIIAISLGVWGCAEDIPEIDPLVVPTNLVLDATVSEDGSGLVTFNSFADNALVYHFYLGLGSSETPTLSQDGKLSYNYKQTGDYTVQVVAYGTGGVSSNNTVDISVQVDYEAPAEVIANLTNGSSKNWVWKKWVPAHLGVGPEFNDDGSPADGPFWYQAAPYEKESVGCLYEDVITFTLNPDQTVSMTLANNGVTYFHVDEAADALGVARPEADQCFDYEISGTSNVGFFESTSGVPGSTSIGMEINGGFMSYFVGTSTYEIMSITNDELYVRTVQDIDGFRLAWYHRFVLEGTSACNKVEKEYNLVWSDEFDTDGAPSSANWSYNTGTGSDGWGNQELQYYTDRPENVIVENGSLKITAKRENFSGSDFTSARLVTEDKFEFTYGKVEMRAKLPSSGGTWPAGWLLGADYATNTWPASGEIDFMEHVGNDPGVVSGSLHSPSSSGSTVNTGTVTLDDPFNEWHVYSVEWEEENIYFYVDGEAYYSYCPEMRDADNYPFDHDFFLILNLAMGGTFGGDVDPAFAEDVFEIDYIRVYQ